METSTQDTKVITVVENGNTEIFIVKMQLLKQYAPNYDRQLSQSGDLIIQDVGIKTFEAFLQWLNDYAELGRTPENLALRTSMAILKLYTFATTKKIPELRDLTFKIVAEHIYKIDEAKGEKYNGFDTIFGHDTQATGSPTCFIGIHEIKYVLANTKPLACLPRLIAHGYIMEEPMDTLEVYPTGFLLLTRMFHNDVEGKERSKKTVWMYYKEITLTVLEAAHVAITAHIGGPAARSIA